MLIRTRAHLPCSPASAWRALHDPAVAASVYAPIVVMTPADGSPWPERWEPGDVIEVSARILGVVPFGRQLIRVGHARVTRGERTHPAFLDTGGALTGPLALARTWDHRMWITASSDDDDDDPATSIWHDQLTIGGQLAWLIAPGLRLAWHLRAWRVARLARDWA